MYHTTVREMTVTPTGGNFVFKIERCIDGVSTLTSRVISPVDSDGFVWKTGPRATISVKSYDEQLQRQQQQQQRNLQAAQRVQKMS